MSKKYILILFLLFSIIKCGTNTNNNDFIDSLIKENNFYYVTYLIIFISSFILAFGMIFIFNIKIKKNQNIALNTTEDTILPAQTDNNLGLENPKNLQEKKKILKN